MRYVFQVGGGLAVDMPTSYVEYNSSLVDRCLQEFTDCSLTIAFWVQVEEFGHTIGLLSTVIDGDSSGIQISVLPNLELQLHIHINDIQYLTQTNIIFNASEWIHIAFAYQNSTGSPEFALYTNFSGGLIHIYPTIVYPFLPENFMSSGRFFYRCNGIRDNR